MATVLVLGNGGREHALSWKLTQSSQVDKVFVAPGNAGTQLQLKTINIVLDLKNFQEIADFCKEKNVSLVIVGPEDPLAAGITDFMITQGIPCFGPSALAAEIEASKDFAKQFMGRHQIPTARYSSFTDSDAAVKYIKESIFPALVVKASGLAAGKGVVVAKTPDEACQAVKDILCNKTFGKAGEVVIVEEMLYGEEVSCLAFSDGSSVALMPAAQDHKQLLDGDTGPNTGGMGAVCPYPLISESDLEKIKTEIIQKAVDGMKAEGRPYVGVLYAGLMLTKEGPKVLEFNCRFGDPETQSILPLMKSDLYSVCKVCVEGRLLSCKPEFDLDKFVVGVVKVTGGYPGSYKKNMEIQVPGMESAKELGSIIFHAGTTLKNGKLVTNGGRVLAVMATNSNLAKACDQAQQGAKLIHFTDDYHRSDIGFRIRNNMNDNSSPKLSYKDSGVDIDAGNSLVKAIKPLAESSKQAGCMSSLGGFGALFDLKAAGYRDPILVSGTDGVGTKLKIAQEIGNHTTIGKDLVAMCVNDILAHGAQPLFFLDYFATGHLDVAMAAEVVAGIAEGCIEAGCSLVGGETAEMPGMYKGGEYDLAGFAVGAVERDKILPKVKDIQLGDVLIGLPSSGIHSNGFSLVRKVVEKTGLKYDMPSPLGTGKSLGEELLVPTRIYVKQVLPLLRSEKVKAFCHITGGGLVENLPRILPDHLTANLDALKWDIPSIFGWLSYKGNIATKEMLRTFNCGVGGVLVVAQSDANTVIDEMAKENCKASIIGEVNSAEDRVVVENLSQALSKSWRCPQRSLRKKKVGVLISGSGTNLQSLIDHTTENNNSSAEITLVISNKAGVKGLERAERAGIKTVVINHRDYDSREKFDGALHKALTEADVDIVCLAGFMRILTGGFVRKWNGRMLNIHPSLLPSFKGHNPHEQVIKANVRISGCTVHYVAEEVDAGAIIVQESVPVYPGDSISSLSERVKTVEHKAFPRALELVASEQAVLQDDGTINWQLA